MAFQSLATSIRFNATSVGVADFRVASAVAAYKTPTQGAAIDGKVYSYYAQSADGTQWESGSGAWSAATNTLARTTINGTSSGDQSKLAFTTVPIVDVFPSTQPNLEFDFASGTTMLFQQAAAPNGWTKITTYNDYALRIVSGTPGTGGVNSFSSTFAARTTDAHTLTVAELASHQHLDNSAASAFNFQDGSGTPATAEAYGTSNTGAQGGGSGHTHTYDMRVLYVDVILASKN